jgi:hypothetical protein
VIDNPDWKLILQTATDIQTVVEIYDSDASPTDEGFYPGDAIALYSTVSGISFDGFDYTRLVSSIGGITRTITKQANNASVTFSNVSRDISTFEFTTGFEGLIMVIRTISVSNWTTDLDLCQILFAGRCEKPTSGDKNSLTVTANWILGGIEVQIPRRRFTNYDQEGRTASDANFEGFLFMPEEGTITYSTRVKRGGFLGLLGFKKTVKNTLSYSSHSDLDANKYVPEIFGNAQILLAHIAYEDVGAELRGRSAASEGEIYDITNARAVQSLLAFEGDYSVFKGKTGAANSLGGLETNPWPGNPSPYNHYYSKTSGIIWHASNSDVSVDEPAPDVAALISGRLVTIPDASGEWTNTGQFSMDPAAQTRFVITSADYFKLDESWIEPDDFTEGYNFNREQITALTTNDFVFLVAG